MGKSLCWIESSTENTHPTQFIWYFFPKFGNFAHIWLEEAFGPDHIELKQEIIPRWFIASLTIHVCIKTRLTLKNCTDVHDECYKEKN